jgi:hypothetical protein
MAKTLAQYSRDLGMSWASAQEGPSVAAGYGRAYHAGDRTRSASRIVPVARRGPGVPPYPP